MELDCYVSFLFYCCALASSKRYIGLCGTLLKLSVPIQVVEKVVYLFRPRNPKPFLFGTKSQMWVGGGLLGKKHCYIFLVLVGPWVGQWVAQLNIPCHCLRVCLPAWLPLLWSQALWSPTMPSPSLRALECKRELQCFFKAQIVEPWVKRLSGVGRLLTLLWLMQGARGAWGGTEVWKLPFEVPTYISCRSSWKVVILTEHHSHA